MKNFLRSVDKETFILDIKDPIKKAPKLSDCKLKMIDSTTLEVEISKKHNLNTLFKHFQKNGIEIISMRRKTARLEELFMNLVDKNES